MSTHAPGAGPSRRPADPVLSDDWPDPGLLVFSLLVFLVVVAGLVTLLQITGWA
jgi:hypothetical protein